MWTGETYASPSLHRALGAISIAGIVWLGCQAQPPPSAPAADDTTWSGIWVFTKGYHCLARMDPQRTSLSDAELEALPAEEQVAYYEQLLGYSGTAGTYRVEGDTLRRQWDISLEPDILGLESVTTFSVEGDRLTVDLPRRSPDSGPSVQVVYRRLE